MIQDPLKNYTAVVAEFKQNNTPGPVATLLRAKREAVKEEMVVAGCKPERRQELAGAAQVLDDMIQELTKPQA